MEKRSLVEVLKKFKSFSFQISWEPDQRSHDASLALTPKDLADVVKTFRAGLVLGERGTRSITLELPSSKGGSLMGSVLLAAASSDRVFFVGPFRENALPQASARCPSLVVENLDYGLLSIGRGDLPRCVSGQLTVWSKTSGEIMDFPVSRPILYPASFKESVYTMRDKLELMADGASEIEEFLGIVKGSVTFELRFAGDKYGLDFYAEPHLKLVIYDQNKIAAAQDPQLLGRFAAVLSLGPPYTDTLQPLALSPDRKLLDELYEFYKDLYADSSKEILDLVAHPDDKDLAIFVMTLFEYRSQAVRGQTTLQQRTPTFQQAYLQSVKKFMAALDLPTVTEQSALDLENPPVLKGLLEAIRRL